MKIAAHCVVKNEQNWIWYTIRSVLSFVDELDIVDTGSTDETVAIITSISSPKIKLSIDSISHPQEFTLIRQRQLTSSKADWILILDGDEVWTDSALNASLNSISTNPTQGFLISSYLNCVGDIYHVQPAAASHYKINSHTGPISIRWFRNHAVNFSNPYGSEGLFTKSHTPLQESSLPSTFIPQPYFHMTHLTRSHEDPNSVIQRQSKYKYELGTALPQSVAFPKCFYFPHPPSVPSPWTPRPTNYLLNALWQTPLKTLKRALSNA